MSAQVNVVLNDGQTTPVAVTFNPKGAKKQPDGRDKAVWRNQAALNAEGYLTIDEHHTDPKPGPNSVEKFTFVITKPVLETVSFANEAGVTPAPTVAYNLVAVLEFRYPKRATEAELQDIVAFAKNLAATEYVANAVVKREAAW